MVVNFKAHEINRDTDKLNTHINKKKLIIFLFLRFQSEIY